MCCYLCTHTHTHTDRPHWASWGGTPGRRARWSSEQSPVYEPPLGSARSPGSPSPAAAPGSPACRLQEGRIVLHEHKYAQTINHSLAPCIIPLPKTHRRLLLESWTNVVVWVCECVWVSVCVCESRKATNTQTHKHLSCRRQDAAELLQRFTAADKQTFL